MIKLTPSIDAIQNALFAPSYALVVTWAERPETLDTATLKKLEASTLALQEKQAYQESKTLEDDNAIKIANKLFINQDEEPDAAPQNNAIPDAIKNLISQRSRAARHQFSASPREGLIMLLGKGDGTAEDLGLAIASPLVVILNKPTTNKQVWEGWVVAKEKNYASDWDFLLNEERDGSLDPLAGMVQTWNPVSIYTPLLEKAIGEIPATRLQTLRTLANQYKKTIALTGENGIHSEAIQQYQQLYTKAAALIEKKAPKTAQSPFEAWKTAFLSQTDALGKIFTPVSVVNHAMGAENDDQNTNWQLDKDYLFNFNKQKVGGKLLIEISIKHINLDEDHFMLEYKENGYLAHHQVLSKKSPNTTFICDPDNPDIRNPTELIIKDANGNELHRLNLSNPVEKNQLKE